MSTEPPAAYTIMQALCTPECELVALPLLQGIQDIASNAASARKVEIIQSERRKLCIPFSHRETQKSQFLSLRSPSSKRVFWCPFTGQGGPWTWLFRSEGLLIGAMGLWVANFIALMGWYPTLLCVSQFVKMIPDEKNGRRPEIRIIAIKCNHHVVDCH